MFENIDTDTWALISVVLGTGSAIMFGLFNVMPKPEQQARHASDATSNSGPPDVGDPTP